MLCYVHMLCYITCVILFCYVIQNMLYDICYVMLYNMCYVMLYNICYVIWHDMLCYITYVKCYVI